MPKKPTRRKNVERAAPAEPPSLAGRGRGRVTAAAGRPSALLDTRIIYCGDCLDQLRKLPAACVDLIYIDPPFNSNRNYEVFWGERSEPRPQGSGSLRPFKDRHAPTPACIHYMRPRRALSKWSARKCRGRPATILLQTQPRGCAAADRLLSTDPR